MSESICLNEFMNMNIIYCNVILLSGNSRKLGCLHKRLNYSLYLSLCDTYTIYDSHLHIHKCISLTYNKSGVLKYIRPASRLTILERKQGTIY